MHKLLNHKNTVLFSTTIITILLLFGIHTSYIQGENAELLQSNEELQKAFKTLALEREQGQQEKEVLEKELLKLQEELENYKKESKPSNSKSQGQKEETKKPAADKRAYLTFDDGPSANTAKILDILKEYDIKATFFVIGSETEANKKLYKRIVEEGHAIGNHTYTHNYSKIYKSVEAFMEDLKKLEDLLDEVAGVRPNIIRFPGGSKNGVSTRAGGSNLMNNLIAHLKEEGYQYFDWNVSSKDASAVTQDKKIIINSVLEGVQGKKDAIILFHDNAPKTTTVQALPEIIESLQSKGYSFEVLSKDSYYVHYR